tara:strand:+ start:235 stop:471 length:237 start_codon:yes stop_codon:yes gene_type:complete
MFFITNKYIKVHLTCLDVFIIKRIMRINWINGFDAGNKKEKYSLTLRLGTLTLFELKVDKTHIRFMLVNFGFELSYNG